MDIRETAQRVLGYLDDIARQLTVSPDAQVPLLILGPSEALTTDIVALVKHATTTGGPARMDYSQQQQPDAPTATADMREGFLTDMRSSWMFPDASETTVTPPMLAALVRVYLIGRMSEVRRSSGGWKAAEVAQRDYGHVMQPHWVPGPEWRWWAVAAPVAAPFRMPGHTGQGLADFMSQPPVWR